MATRTASHRTSRLATVLAVIAAVLVVIASPAVGAVSVDRFWGQLGIDLDGEARGHNSGYSVAMSSDGNTIIVGAHLNNGTGPQSGHARVYQWNNNAWVQVGNDIDGEAAGDLSGVSVAISGDGDKVIVGAPGNDAAGTSAGHARVYQWNNSAWVQVGGDIDGEAEQDRSGWSVAMSRDGTTVVVGSYRNESYAGHARVYRWDGTAWVQVGGDIDGEAEDDRSGWSVAMSSDGTTVIIGSPGRARVFQWTSTAWVQVGDEIDSEAGGDQSGYSVAMSGDGDTVVVGAPYNDGFRPNAGHARVYHWNGTTWVQVGADIDGEAAADRSGWSVAMSSDGTTVIIGANGNDGAGLGAGHARVFQWTGTAWVQVDGDIDGEADYDNSGHAVAMSSDGTTVIIGAPTNDGTDTNAGHARVYRLADAPANKVPTAVDDADSTDEDTAITTIDVLANDIDPDDSDVLFVSGLDTSATRGVATSNGDGTFRYDPAGQFEFLALGESDTDTFGYTVSDGNGGSDTAKVTIRITGRDDVPGALWGQLGADVDGEAAGDWSGYAVATSGDGNTVIVGAPWNDGTRSNAGHARVYHWDGAAWAQLGDDIGGEAAGDRSGFAVAMSSDGSTVIIGAARNDAAGRNAGHARVYRWDNSAWVQVGDDIDGEAPVDQSGFAVAMSSDGNTVIIGARRNDGHGSNAGHARVYRWDGTAWVQVGGDIDGEAAVDQSGRSVAMSSDGNTVIIGARRNDGNGTNAGHARVYRWDGSAWGQVGDDIDGEAAYDQSGFAVAMSSDGNTVIVGAPYNDGSQRNAGHARVYRWEGTAWAQVGRDIDGEAGADRSGYSVAMSGDGNTVVIGANGNDGAGLGAGHARVYHWNGIAWVQVDGDIDGEAAHDQSGHSVAMSGDGSTVIIGARLNDAAGLGAGHARIFQVSAASANRAPTAADDAATTDENTAIASIDVLSNDTDPDVSDVLFASAVDDASTTGTVTLLAGVVSYDPAGQFDSLSAGETTTDTFRYTVSDGNGGSDTATVTITITGLNDAPSAADDADSTDEDTAFTTIDVLSNDTDPNTSDVLSVSDLDPAGTQGTVTDNGDGTFEYDPAGQFESLGVGESDTDTFEYTVSDGNGGSDTATVTITITGLNDAPTATDDAYRTDKDTPIAMIEVLSNDTDPDASDGLYVSAVDDTGTIGTVTLLAGVLSYDPAGQFESLTIGETAADTFSYTVSDGNGGSDTATATVTIHGAVWVQLGADIDGEAAGDWSGYSVAVSTDGNTIIIGAPNNDGTDTDAGHARVYRWNSTTFTWVQVGADIDGPPDNHPQYGNQSGWSVAMSGDGNTVIIGGLGPGIDPDGWHARVYRWSDATSTWIQLGDLDGPAYDAPADSVAMSSDGNTIIIGSPYGLPEWQVAVYRWDGTTSTWEQMGELEGGRPWDSSGNSVAMSSDGNAIIIGAPEYGGVAELGGQARVYRWNGITSSWVQVGDDLNGAAEADYFGWSVAMSSDGNTIVVGATFSESSGRAGHARVYQWNNTSWVQVGVDIEGEALWDASGNAVAMSSDGNTVIIGAPSSWRDPSKAGRARVYRWNNNSSTWVQVGVDLDGEAARDEFGYSAAMSGDGNTVIVGGFRNDGTGGDAGHARVYRLTD